MRHSGRPVILAVSHGLGGGVEQYVRELREMVGREAEMLLLTPTSYGAVVLRNLDPEDDFNVALDVELDYPALLELLRYCGVTRMHIQHMSGHSLDLERLRQDLGVPVDFSVHDYAVVCPQVTLSDASGRYCGEPDAAGCNACLAARPARPRLDIASWRERYAPLVNHADRVIAPSQDAAERMRRYFPQAKVVAAAHPAAAAPPGRPQQTMVRPTGPLVIAVLGAMTPHKGIGRLRACAGAAQREKLPLRFGLAGYVDTGRPKPEPFVQTGHYRNDQLPGLLGEMGAHVVWFPAQWPETFSYTLSVCLELGVPVVAPDIGAFPERLAGRSWTWIVPWDWDTGRMLEFFVSARQDHFLTGIAPAVPRADVRRAVVDFYPLQYLMRG
jgi:glycosyltransferase involved in cell wall biosynthesis